MFSIVLVIFSITLVVIMIAAGIWYGGQIFVMHSEQAEANKILSDINQVRGSTVMYETYKGSSITEPHELVNQGFLKQFPAGWEVQDGYLVLSDVSDSACKIVNHQYGYDESAPLPTCEQVTASGDPFLGCCTQ